mmetsp:Transcript_20456/g.32747  ORF Transcript_20456/g.32747 Transcript_20456/m.32747 type:complete len:351 (+) Transcript_20456:207-1259(+)
MNLSNLFEDAIFLGGKHSQVQQSARVSPLVIVPRDNFHQTLAHHHTGIGIKNGGASVANHVLRHNQVFSVAQKAFQRGLRCFLHRRLHIIVRGVLLEHRRQINHRSVRHWHTKRHSIQLAIQRRNYFANRFRGTSGRRNDVAERSTTISPSFSRRRIHRLLRSGNRMYRGHQSILDAKCVIQHFHHWRQTIGGARRIRDNVHFRVQLVSVDVHAEHWRSLGWRRDEHFLGARSQVLFGAFAVVGGVLAKVLLEDTSALQHVHRASLGPANLFWVALLKHLDLFAIHDQVVAVGGDSAFERTLRRIVFELIHHIIWRDERIVDSNNLQVISGRSDTQNHASNASKTIDTDL